jgi:hypothetical protein
MLAVMCVLSVFYSSNHSFYLSFPRTFHAAFIISIIVGLGIGEVMFGRVEGAEGPTAH